jgi:hypothetical protein
MSGNTSLDGFLNEMMASMSQGNRDAMMRRINAERLIKLIAEKLVELHQAESIRLIADNRLIMQDAADYLVQVDEYDLRLVLLDSTGEKPSLTVDLMQEWVALLRSNPSTTALIAVWANDELSSIALSMRRLQHLIEQPSELGKLPQNLDTFENVISTVIRKQTKSWKIPRIDPNKPSSGQRDLYSIFSEKIIRAIDAEANRRYRTEERLKAAQKFPAEQEKQAILKILQDALDGKPAKDLEKRLTSLSRRGEK